VSAIETLFVQNAGALDLAFDASGNLWIVNVGNGVSLQEYSALQLAALRVNGSPAPVVTITSSALANTTGLAFDPSGNLWAAAGNSGFQEFSVAQLAAGGSQTPNVTVRPCVPGPLAGSQTCGGTPRLAFDTAGNLWSVQSTSIGGGGAGEENAVYELSHASIGATGSPTPAAQFKLPANAVPGGELICPWNDITFDASGNLWVAFIGVYFEFTKAQLTSANPNPVLAVNLYGYSQAGSPNTTDYVASSNIALDASGDVFAFAGNGPFKTMTPAQYEASSPSSTSDSGPGALGITVGPYHP